ncbi:MAG TPA: TonB family protein, partial [Burkholderiaceae bacterium]
ILVLFFYCCNSFASETITTYDRSYGPANCKEPPTTSPESPRIVDYCKCIPQHYRPGDMVPYRGTVEIEFEVGEDNKLIGARILKSSGYKAIDVTTLRGQSLCKFQAASKGGKPVRASFIQSYTWDEDNSTLTMKMK